MTISRCSAFTSQPVRTSSVASQSSSSGCDGGSPWTPKFSAVLTRPVPKWCCQIRLTVTRAVSGFSGAASHRARPSRLRGTPEGNGGRHAGTPGSSFLLVSGMSYWPALEHDTCRAVWADLPSPSPTVMLFSYSALAFVGLLDPGFVAARPWPRRSRFRRRPGRCRDLRRRSAA